MPTKADPSKCFAWGSADRFMNEWRPMAGYNAGLMPRKRERMQQVDESSIESAPGVQGPHPGKAWPAEIRAEAFALFKKGYGYRKAAAELGIPLPTVKTWKRSWKTENSDTKHSSPKKSGASELRIKAIELFEKGDGFKKAASQLGVPVSTVRGWKNKWKAGNFSATDPLPSKLWAPEVRAEAVALFEKGNDYNRVAAQLGIPAPTAYGWEQKWKAGNFQPTYPTCVRRYSEEIKNKAYDLRKAGLSLEEIHRELQVSQSTLYRWLLKKDLISKRGFIRKKMMRYGWKNSFLTLSR